MPDVTAAQVSIALSARFFRSGQYVNAQQLTGRADGILPAAAAAAQDVVEEFFEIPAFAGLAVQSVGYEKGGDKPRVHVYVTKGSKKALAQINAEETSDVEVVIDRVGRVQVKPEAASGSTSRGSVYERKGRIACGSSCAPSTESYAGTLGALVKKKGRAELYVLSNNHVLAACNHVPIGMPILAPSTIDAAPGVRAPEEVARHSEIHELRSGEPNLVPPVQVDAALARVTDPSKVSSWQGSTDGYDTPSKIGAPASGMRVKKYGRTTGLTLGTLEALINTPMPVPYRCRLFTASVFFLNVWTIRADPGEQFALGGDSGSLVVTEDGSEALGLVFAEDANGSYGWMIPLEAVMPLFGDLRLVASHGV